MLAAAPSKKLYCACHVQQCSEKLVVCYLQLSRLPTEPSTLLKRPLNKLHFVRRRASMCFIQILVHLKLPFWVSWAWRLTDVSNAVASQQQTIFFVCLCTSGSPFPMKQSLFHTQGLPGRRKWEEDKKNPALWKINSSIKAPKDAVRHILRKPLSL